MTKKKNVRSFVEQAFNEPGRFSFKLTKVQKTVGDTDGRDSIERGKKTAERRDLNN